MKNIIGLIKRHKSIAVGLFCFLLIILLSTLFVNNNKSSKEADTSSSSSSSASSSSPASNSDTNGDSSDSSSSTSSQQVSTDYTVVAPSKITISNYDNIVKNLPENQKEGIEGMVYQMAKQNGHDSTALVAQIRTNSYSQQYDSVNDQYSTAFVVDLPDIKQSYSIKNTYNSQSPTSVGYPTVISCPPSSYLIYGDFNCQELKMHQ